MISFRGLTLIFVLAIAGNAASTDQVPCTDADASCAAVSDKSKADGLIQRNQALMRDVSEQADKRAPLSNNNPGCHVMASEAECVASKDGRRGHFYSDSPCQWCCGRACTTNNANKCEPKEWLMQQPNYVGMSKNGIGEDTCQASGALSNNNPGCHVLASEAECVASKDGRRGHFYSDSPCQWCCGRACTTNNANKCEPNEWLMQQPNYVGMSKNGVGEDTCQTTSTTTKTTTTTTTEPQICADSVPWDGSKCVQWEATYGCDATWGSVCAETPSPADGNPKIKVGHACPDQCAKFHRKVVEHHEYVQR